MLIFSGFISKSSHSISNYTIQKFVVCKVLFIYSKNSNIVKYYYNLK